MNEHYVKHTENGLWYKVTLSPFSIALGTTPAANGKWSDLGWKSLESLRRSQDKYHKKMYAYITDTINKRNLKDKLK